MSQRRPNSSKPSSNNGGIETIHKLEVLPDEAPPFIMETKPLKKGALSLETSENTEELSVEDRFQLERHQARVRHWRNSPFAVGLVERSWREERARGGTKNYGDEDLQSDETGCLCCSAHVCPLFGAGRVGNMVVLRASQEWVEEVEEDEESGEVTTQRYQRPKIDCVVGPYWPMLVCVTYPLILGLSGWTFYSVIFKGLTHPILMLVWFVLTTGLVSALAFTACCDPGIQYRVESPPPQEENLWSWVDRAHSYRRKNSHYDVDTAVIVEGFDHTCPWTGTAIGRRNMFPFQMFVCLVFLCLIMDLFLLTGVFDTRL